MAVELTTRTIYLGHLMSSKLLNRPFSVLPNSTLNQKFNLYPNELPAVNEYPSLAYIGIGNKGASYEVTGDGYVLTTPIPHLPRDASLYNFIPFAIRDINDDLSATERLKYRLRVPVTIGGKNYVAYYLRVLPTSNVIPSVELRNVNGESITTTAFTPTLSDLSPNQPNLSNVDLNNPNGDYLFSTAKINFTLNQTDITNILDACAIMYGDPRYAVINEIALCAGIDRILQGTFGGTTSNYTEVVVSQVTTYISQYHALSANTTEVNISLDVGSSEGLLI